MSDLNVTTRDLGHAVADLVVIGIGQLKPTYVDQTSGALMSPDYKIETVVVPDQFSITEVDKRDPNNPLVTLSNGQKYRLHIYPEITRV